MTNGILGIEDDGTLWCNIEHRLCLIGGFAAFEPFGLWPATRAAMRKNVSSRVAFYHIANAAKPNALDDIKGLSKKSQKITREQNCQKFS
jgi:hypothetical protein